MPTYAAEDLTRWRDAIIAAWRDQLDEPPEGWSISPADFVPVVAVLPSLAIKDPYVWRAYQYRARDSGHGRVFAVPRQAEWPEPAPAGGGEVSGPPHALGHLADSLEGDASAESYVQASILRREMDSFGTAGHGSTRWDECRIVDAAPFDPALDGWEWREEPPDDWRPRVDVVGDEVVVRIYTVTSFDQEQVCRHTDVYRRGSYHPETRIEVVAQGPPGYVT